MPITSLKVLSSCPAIAWAGRNIQSDHQGIDALLNDLRGQTSKQRPRFISGGAALFEGDTVGGGFRRAGYGGGGGFRRAGLSGVLGSILVISSFPSGIGMSADDPDPFGFPDQPISQLLVKVASRCNIDCSYCYWFRDAAVYDKPKLMSADVLHRLLQRIEEHVASIPCSIFPLFCTAASPCCGESRTFTVLPRPAKPSRRGPAAKYRSR